MKTTTKNLSLLLIFLTQNINNLQAQDSDENFEKRIFSSTYWEPGKGVRLLKSSISRKMWKKYEEKCDLSDFDDKDFPIKENYLFSTEYHMIFVYNVQMKGGPRWTICDKNSKRKLFDSESFGSGYRILDDSSLEPLGACLEHTIHNVHVRFKPYEENHLMLEMSINICQRSENYHEFLFHLDKEGITIVKGSNFVLGDIINGPLAYWTYNGSSYSRLGKTSMNDKGERIWKRRLEVAVRGVEQKGPVWEFNCKYDKEKREVSCTRSLLKREKLLDINLEDFCETSSVWPLSNKHKVAVFNELEVMGFEISEDVKKIVDEPCK